MNTTETACTAAGIEVDVDIDFEFDIDDMGNDYTAGADIAIASTSPDALAALLAEAAPSAGVLDTLELKRLSAGGQLDAVVACVRHVRRGQARLIESLHALACDPSGDGIGLAESEVCAALAWAPSTAQNRLREADALMRLFPEAVQLLAEGRISVEQARCLVELTAGLEDAAARSVGERVLPRMPGKSVAVTRQAIRRAILRADPDAATKRHEYARTRRRVELFVEEDGMATLSFYLPADIAQMAMRTLTAMAQKAKLANKDRSDKRTLDQRRADLLPVLVHRAVSGAGAGAGAGSGGGTFSGRPAVPAHVNVVVGIETLLRLSHEPGHMEGYGPICAEQARDIAREHASRWRFLLTSSDGTLIDASPRTYTPGAALKRIAELKHMTCGFPHCAMPSGRCDIDHAVPFGKGGLTTEANLAPICRCHHNLKTRGQWQLNGHGDYNTWTSNHTGRTYTTSATRYQPAPTIE